MVLIEQRSSRMRDNQTSARLLVSFPLGSGPFAIVSKPTGDSSVQNDKNMAETEKLGRNPVNFFAEKNTSFTA